MPLVFLGVNALIGFLGWLLIPVIGYVVRVWGMGLARISLALTAFLALVLGLGYVSLELLRAVYAELPPEVAANAMLFIPSNAVPCMYVLLVQRSAIFIFDVKNKVLDYLDWRKS
ncbi:DUF5455 family protein [Salmonella enterica]|uniref:Phage coat protein n=1 Tax=Salmonella enterica TaxID=28901 RepID=A0A760RQH5_SALER|nr:phage coat protein [Salmonella enterica]ECI2239427.1 phage coat protein [Salmonella enterica subsp. enterica]EDG7302020.1 phage coat protein [Salmonella enterica subsp. enterica serovar Bareilly]EDP9435738.1 phage coat protein [Salmonella enterica subsp. enterica serovar Irumu]EDY0720126.1 phage coat protein [Salmonella enterica subsp. enterica]